MKKYIRMKKYILNNMGEPVLEPNLMKWARWFEDGENRRVARTEIGPTKVSTVFLGLDHGFDPDEGPILWETLTFGGPFDQTLGRRCGGSREQAIAMHESVCNEVTLYLEKEGFIKTKTKKKKGK